MRSSNTRQCTRGDVRPRTRVHRSRTERRRVAPPLSAFGGSVLTMAHELEGGVDVLVVRGEIDISTAARFQEALSAAVSGGHGSLVLDLSEVTFIDSTAVHILSTSASALDAQRRPFAVACAEGRPVHRVLSLTGLPASVAVYPSRHSALLESDERLAIPDPFLPEGWSR
jgi:anti-sigma B factor antagonist